MNIYTRTSQRKDGKVYGEGRYIMGITGVHVVDI